MKRRVTVSSLVACVLALVWSGSNAISAQDTTKTTTKAGATQTVSDKAQQFRGNAQEDPNVRAKRAANDRSKTTPAPANKGEQATRGGVCVVHVDNRTPWVIDVYVDGDYAGTVGRWGDIYPLAGSGATRLYARADFTDGAVTTWGPRVVQCNAGSTFHWTLNP